MSKKSKTYLSILENAKTLFWKYGIKKVSVEEISAAAGISKMTFYRQFSNKEEVAGILLKEIMDKGYQDYEKIMSQKVPFETKLKEIISLKKTNAKEVSMEFMKDIFSNKNSNLAELIEKQRVKSNKRFETDLKLAQENGELRKGLKIEFIMYMLDSVFHLMEDPKLINIFDSSVDLSDEITNFFFFGMLKSKEV